MNPDQQTTPQSDAPPPEQAETTAAAIAPTEQAPDWQAPDYAGPLDLNQAAWRNRNLKPAVADVQKAGAKQGAKAR